MKVDCRVTRTAQVSAALNAIYEALGRRREIEVMSAFERDAAEVHGPPDGFPLLAAMGGIRAYAETSLGGSWPIAVRPLMAAFDLFRPLRSRL